MYAELLKEQGHVCVYCGATITTERHSGHIEHFFPSTKVPPKRFSWENLLASCGPPHQKGQPSICGDAKHDWLPTGYVDPLLPDCEYHFQFDGTGEIDGTPLGGMSAKTMIKKLKLNDKSLTYQRFQIVLELENQILASNINAANVAAEVAAWRTRDGLGRLKSFGHAAARYLDDQSL